MLAGFKIGCVIEYKVAQAAAGILPKETGEFFRKTIDMGFRRNAEFVLGSMRSGGRLLRTWKAGAAKLKGYL